jgi:hypothetical protein
MFTNDQKAEGLEAKPVDLSSADAPGASLDLPANLGRVVMVTGAYAQATGITKAQVVDTASPLLSFMLKQAGGDEGAQAPPRAAGGRRPGASGAHLGLRGLDLRAGLVEPVR